MKLLYCNRKKAPRWKPSAPRCLDGRPFPPERFRLRARPLERRHAPLIGLNQFAQMKPTGILINTSRGAVVDEAALVEALKSRRIYSAGLDVYEHEPELAPGLADLENAVLLSHIGNATAQTRHKMGELAATNLIAMLAGKNRRRR